jgi:hypothetical protein
MNMGVWISIYTPASSSGIYPEMELLLFVALVSQNSFGGLHLYKLRSPQELADGGP